MNHSLDESFLNQALMFVDELVLCLVHDQDFHTFSPYKATFSSISPSMNRPFIE